MTSLATTPSAEPAAVGEDGADSAPAERPLERVRWREVALVTVLVSVLYLPALGKYTLWDPWETHYAEVARRMLEEHDWIRLKWQDENFRSKPVLTFWMMAAGMKLVGAGEDGGFSGEFTTSWRAEWGIRLPFALFGIFGVVILWYAIARLHSKRAAWLAAVVLATCPYYFFISRQAITDMPSCAMLIGSMALFALAIFEDPDRPLSRWRGGITACHGFLAAFVLLVLPQLLYFTLNLGDTKLRLSPTRGIPGPLVMIPFWVGFVGVAVWTWFATRTTRQVYMYFFYVLSGLAVLAKGPVAPALAGLTILVYLALTGEWRLLLRVELVRGVLIALVVALPWHFAIYLKDGNPWLNEYVNQHLFNRAFKGVFGDRGTFTYFFKELGVGMWPWVALVPGALATLAVQGRARTREEKLRLLVGIWAIVGFFFFAAVQTKFHHYILPAVPALAVLVAFWLDDLLEGRVRFAVAALAVAGIVFLLTSMDVVSNQLRLVNLFIFRYDRPFPTDAPWNIDYTRALLVFAVLGGAALAAMFFQAVRREAVVGACLVAILFTWVAIQDLLVKVAPHWGQRHLHEVYYRNRTIYGVDLQYMGMREFTRDWGSGQDLEVRSVIPETLNVGDPMRVTYMAGGQQGDLYGQVSRIDRSGHRFFIAVAPEERQELAPLVERGRASKDPPRRRYVSINAERMVAWQLNWRGENFYSGGEIFQHRFPDARTVYKDTNNDAFKRYVEEAQKRWPPGRKFWVITEKARLANLGSVLRSTNPGPSFPKAAESVRTEDNSSNKFALGSFVLEAPSDALADRDAPPAAPTAPAAPAAPAPSGASGEWNEPGSPP